MAAAAEITIADEVYHHVQSLSLAYHLSRETGKVVRIVSRGSQSFVSILRMIFYNLLSIFAEITLTLTISAAIFNWTFTALQIFSLVVYFVVTYTVTEARAKGFKAK
jgi:ABC-type transport system involved in Fe-S cluster assembly fused permease/ATPase subunit